MLTVRCLQSSFSVNEIVPKGQAVNAALQVAHQIVQNSPDAVQSTKQGLLLAQQHDHEQTVLTHVRTAETKRVYKGDNIKV